MQSMSVRPVMGRVAAVLLFAVAPACAAPARLSPHKRILFIHQNEEYSPAAQEVWKRLLDRSRGSEVMRKLKLGSLAEVIRFPVRNGIVQA
jgi:hypothetical protein